MRPSLSVTGVWLAVTRRHRMGIPVLDENTTFIETILPFALPLPFVIAGFALLTIPRTFTFDRQTGRLRIANLWRQRILVLDEVKSLQLIPGQTIEQTIQKGSFKRHPSRSTSYSTVQLNLVIENPEFPRINISHDAGRHAAVETGRALSSFLNVPLVDGTGLTET
jgi:hypothetical protein